jgi:hypothetical protein
MIDGGPAARLEVEPTGDQTIAVVAGQTPPTISYSATLGGQSVAVAWRVDRGEIGTVEEGPSAGAVFSPSGDAGGVVTLFAALNGSVIERRIMVNLQSTHKGPSGSSAEQSQIAAGLSGLTDGGGVGGVGGEGLGTQVSDSAMLAALDAPTGDGSVQGLAFLYPYEGTVWPRGLLAPLVQWDWSVGDADAIKIELVTTAGSFSYSGTFGRPAILHQTGGNFIRHPIPQDAWAMATTSAGGTNSPRTACSRRHRPS